jgi:hypothetical protein
MFHKPYAPSICHPFETIVRSGCNMSKPLGSFGSQINSAFGNLLKLFGISKKTPVLTTTPYRPVLKPEPVLEPARMVASRVLLVIYDPVMDPFSQERLSHKMNWRSVDELVNGFISDIADTSRGLARYQVVERVELNEFPAKTDGFRYDPLSIMAVLSGGQPHSPTMIDYHSILKEFNILERVNKREIDEVWLFAYPHAGFYESRMAGAGAFWCNSPELENTFGCSRRFVIMGFSYERQVGEMLESFGHRSESILTKTFEKLSYGENLFERFSRFDKQNPGQAEVGSIHFAPNSESDYDWNNQRLVPSRCDDWVHFPAAPGPARQVNSDEWGNGDIRLHHKWWLRHLPRVAGRTRGVANNWWQYIMDPNLIDL